MALSCVFILLLFHPVLPTRSRECLDISDLPRMERKLGCNCFPYPYPHGLHRWDTYIYVPHSSSPLMSYLVLCIFSNRDLRYSWPGDPPTRRNSIRSPHLKLPPFPAHPVCRAQPHLHVSDLLPDMVGGPESQRVLGAIFSPFRRFRRIGGVIYHSVGH